MTAIQVEVRTYWRYGEVICMVIHGTVAQSEGLGECLGGSQ